MTGWLARLRAMAFGGLVLCVGLFVLTGCQPVESVLRVGANPWPGYDALFYARERGHLTPDRVRLLDFPSNVDSMRAFRNGALDAVAVTLDEALLLADHAQSPKVVLVFDVSQGGDAVLAARHVDSISDLRGRRIGLETNGVGAYMLVRTLEAGGLTRDDVQVVNLPLHQQEQAFHEGRVDAVVTFDPVRSRLIQTGARELFSSRQIPNEIVDVLVVREQTLRTHPAALQHLVHAYFQGLADMLRAGPDAAEQLAPRHGMTASALMGAWSLMDFPDRALNRQLLRPGGSLSATLRQMESVLRSYQLITRPVSRDALTDDRLLQEGA